MLENELIIGLRNGDEPAYRQLVDLYQNKVYNTVLGLLQQEQEAEDLTQEVFIKIFHTIGSFRGESQLATWIYRIAVTQSLDFLRKKNRQKRSASLTRFFGGGAEETEVPDFFHPGVKAERKEESAVLFRAIRQLPENQQAAFVLQKLEGLNQNEIAAIMKTSVSSVESLLHRAKQNLRKLLTSYYKPDHEQ